MTKKATNATPDYVQHLSINKRDAHLDVKSGRSNLSNFADFNACIGDQTLDLLEKFDAKINPYISKVIDRIEAKKTLVTTKLSKKFEDFLMKKETKKAKKDSNEMSVDSDLAVDLSEVSLKS